MTIDILGTLYEITLATESTDAFLKSCDGYCDRTTKKIVINDYTKENDVEVKNPSFMIKKNTRHELIHAFMFESGLGENWQHKDFGQEETTVDWFAVMFPKMLEAFKAADAL